MSRQSPETPTPNLSLRYVRQGSPETTTPETRPQLVFEVEENTELSTAKEELPEPFDTVARDPNTGAIKICPICGLPQLELHKVTYADHGRAVVHRH